MEIKVVPHKVDAEKLERIAFILKTVAHPVRLNIISLLKYNPELTVTDICETLNTEQSLTSHHLNNMKLKGILSSRRKGRNVFYALKEKDVTQIIECLDNCGCNM